MIKLGGIGREEIKRECVRENKNKEVEKLEK